MSEAKLCKDCRWIRLPQRDGDGPVSVFRVTCLHPTSAWQPSPDMVFGNPRPLEPLPCHEVRQTHELCGPEGKYWEAKEEVA